MDIYVLAIQFRFYMRIVLVVTLHKKIKFSIKNFFSKCDQMRPNFPADLVTFTEKSLMKNFIFCPVLYQTVFPSNRKAFQTKSEILYL